MAEASPARFVVCVGATHHTATLALRERFALVGERGRTAISDLAAHDAVEELVAIATCNRSEMYLVGRDDTQLVQAGIEAFEALGDLDSSDLLDSQFEVRIGVAAAEHLMRTAGGIESVVTGEAQIQGQLRQAHEEALASGSCGQVLDRLFRLAIETGKRARTETQIGSGRASVGSVAAELVAGRIGALTDRRVAVIGAGKMGGLAARSLADRGARNIDVVNRTGERAVEIAAECGIGDGIPFEQLDDELARCDAVVSSTNAPHVLITKERIAAVMQRREGRPLVLVDLAVPRDIDGACAEVDGVHVFDLDDLERTVSETLHVRSGAVEEVAAIATESAEAYVRWLRALDATPAIRELRERAERERVAELERFIARHTHLDEADIARIDQLTRSIVNRVLHAPTQRLREAAERA